MEKKTVLEKLREKHEVTEGFVCYSPRDIRCIDGVCNTPDKFWSITVNGNFKDYNSMSVVLPSDRVQVRLLPALAFVEEK